MFKLSQTDNNTNDNTNNNAISGDSSLPLKKQLIIAKAIIFSLQEEKEEVKAKLEEALTTIKSLHSDFKFLTVRVESAKNENEQRTRRREEEELLKEERLKNEIEALNKKIEKNEWDIKEKNEIIKKIDLASLELSKKKTRGEFFVSPVEIFCFRGGKKKTKSRVVEGKSKGKLA